MIGISAVLTVVGLILWLITKPYFAAEEDTDLTWFFLFLGFIFYWVMNARYRNQGARHAHEKETNATMHNLHKTDVFVTKRTKLSNPKIKGVNNQSIGWFNYSENPLVAKLQKNFTVK